MSVVRFTFRNWKNIIEVVLALFVMDIVDNNLLGLQDLVEPPRRQLQGVSRCACDQVVMTDCMKL